MMTLEALLEKSADADPPRETIGFTAMRLMDLDVETMSAGISDGDGVLGLHAPAAAPESDPGNMMSRTSTRPPHLGRRALLAGAPALALPALAAAVPEIRLGLVQFGTVQWIAEVMRRHGLDAAHGFRLKTIMLASPEAGRIAIMGGQAEMVVLDWPFVAVQRGNGTRLSFAPLSSATGGIMVKPGSEIRSLAQLEGRRLGVAGGPIDKSWLVVQAAARRLHALDLATAARISYGAPPLLEAKLLQGELDAVLTYWSFAARLEARGHVQAISVTDCAVALGLPPRLGLIGFVFREDWATGAGSGIEAFLAAATAAQRILAASPAEWEAIRPLMAAPDDLLFERLRARFVAGITTPADGAAQEESAAALFALLRQTGGVRATDGLERLPDGVFWRGAHAGR